MTGAWFATLADLDEAKAASHDSLVQLMGAGREGPVAWSWWTGEAALDHLARWRHSGPIRSAEHLEYFTELKRRLTTDGGYLIMAFAAGRMTNAS